jgi:hypothetical protein
MGLFIPAPPHPPPLHPVAPHPAAWHRGLRHPRLRPSLRFSRLGMPLRLQKM